MNLLTQRRASPAGKALLAGAAGLGILALANHLAARRTERRHPPEGSFIKVDGVRLHYSDRGEGAPVLLIHGNAVTGDDYNTDHGKDSCVILTHRCRSAESAQHAAAAPCGLCTKPL